MRSTQALVQSLKQLSERVAACEQGFSEFILAKDFLEIYSALEELQSSLEQAGVFHLVWEAVAHAEDMLRHERVEAAAGFLQRATADLVSGPSGR